MSIGSHSRSGGWLRRLPALLVILLAAVAPGLDALLTVTPAMALQEFARAPAVLPGCALVDPELVEIWPIVHGADLRLQRTYVCSQVIVSIDVATFVRQERGKEAVTETNSIVDTAFLSAPQPEVLAVRPDFHVRQYRVDRSTQLGTVWSWYAVGTTPAATATEAKLAEIAHALVLDRSTTSVLSVGAWTDRDPSEVAPLLEAISHNLWQWYLSSL